MGSINDQLKNNFSIECEKCHSKNVNIDFWDGYMDGEISEIGHLIITCNDCKNELDIEDI